MWVMSDARSVAGCLAGLAASLILVGLLSDTVARHVVQTGLKPGGQIP